jgi:hypothetical protein
LQVLLSHGADHKKCPGIMELAASINNIESVRILLKAGVNPDTKKDGTYTRKSLSPYDFAILFDERFEAGTCLENSQASRLFLGFDSEMFRKYMY